jgi:hypothetical protein
VTRRLSLLLVVLSTLPSAPRQARADEAGAPRIRAKDWQGRQGRWRFGDDGVLETDGKTRSSVLVRRDVSARDLDLTVEVMFLGPESSAGFFFRAVGRSFYDDMTFYQFEWYTRGHHHDRRLSLMVKKPYWRWTQIVTPILREAPFNTWITFRLRAQGELIECWIDSARVFSKRDRTYLRAGRLGLHVFQPQRVRFRNLRLTALSTP